MKLSGVVQMMLMSTLVLVNAQTPGQPELSGSNIESPATAGFYQLSWSAKDAVSFELQESTREDFAGAESQYRGPDQATTIVGKRDGFYYYRVRGLGKDGQSGRWSSVVRVEVAHHSLNRAWLFFSIGVIVFLASLVTVLKGASDVKQSNGGVS